MVERSPCMSAWPISWPGYEHDRDASVASCSFHGTVAMVSKLGTQNVALATDPARARVITRLSARLRAAFQEISVVDSHISQAAIACFCNVARGEKKSTLYLAYTPAFRSYLGCESWKEYTFETQTCCRALLLP